MFWQIRKKPVWTGKSIWKGRDGDEVSVEIRALEHYEDCGFRGCAMFVCTLSSC